MEVSGKKLSDQDPTYCQPCSEEGEIIPADAFCTVCKDFLCSTCINEHKALKATKRHTLLDKTSMQTSMTEKINEEDNNVPCDIHPKEYIKYFCPTHETINCGHCVVFEHRSCKISLISEISDSFKSGSEYGDVKTSFDKLLKDVNDCDNDVESNIKMVLKIGEDEVKKLKDYREKVNNYFDEREKSLHEKIEKFKEVDKTRLDSLKPRCDNIKAKVDEIKLKLAAHEKNNANLFIESMRAKKQSECLEAALNDISKENIIHKYEFIKDMATERLLDANTGFGIVSEDQTSENQTGSTVDLTSLKFTSNPAIPVKSPPDTGECWLTDMLVLHDDRLLLADYNHSTLKLVDLQISSVVSQIKVPKGPRGLCLLPGGRVAASIYEECSIIFLETRGQITIRTSIKVEGNCYRMAYFNGKLVVSVEDKKVVLMDMEGNNIKQIDNVNGQSPFGACYNLTLITAGQMAAIFVSDFSKHTITKLDMELNILDKYHDPALREPKGLSAVGKQVLICSSGNHKIMRFDSSSGKMIQLLGESDGIHKPYSAAFSPKQQKMYIISYEYRKGALNDKVQVYKAS